MVEAELRRKVFETAREWIGLNEKDGSHREIVDVYNSHKPLARGYPLQYNDDWCAGFVSAVSIKCGLTDIMPTEVGCGKMIALYQKLGRWMEDDSYIPAPGDVIFYDWEDSGVGDNTGSPNHVGIVYEVLGNTIKVIEGNYSDAVGVRSIAVNGKYIRGFGLPDYASKADPEPEKDCGCAALEARVEKLEEKSKTYKTLDDVPGWAKEEIKRMCLAGLVRGDGNGNLNIPAYALQAYLTVGRAYADIRAMVEALHKEVG